MKEKKFQSTTLYHGEQESALGRVMLAGTTRVRGPHQHSSMRVLEAFALVYVVRGRGIYHNAAEYSQPFEPGDLILLFPELGHQYGPTQGEEFEEFLRGIYERRKEKE